MGSGKSVKSTDNCTRALRVSQLDAQELDNEVIAIIKNQLTKLLKYHKTNILVRYDPEVSAILKLLVWKFSVLVHNSTIGQNILNLKYISNKGETWMTQRQRILYAAILIGLPWLKERLSDVLKVIGLMEIRSKIEKLIEWTDISLKIAALVNFLVFLQKGVYHSLVERVLGIQPVFPDKQGIRQVSFEFMTRELLWHGFSELLFFVLPLVNFQRVKNYLLRKVLPKDMSSQSTSKRNLTECGICGEWPTNPQEIGCAHVFCYYCIQSNYKADPGYCCPLCGINIPDPSIIQHLKMDINLT